MSNSVYITAGYTFFPLEEQQLPALRRELLAFGQSHEMRGLTLLATEGINGTVCGSSAAITAWKKLLTEHFGPITFKDSSAEKPVFRRWSVKIKPEIVAIKRDSVKPAGRHRHLTPQEWNAKLEKKDITVIDARNHFEVELGRFRGAVDPMTTHFSEFPEYVATSNIPKDKEILLYCTGGIRCEKAIIAMEEQGYKNVFQLEGGILAYLEQCPEGSFEGECFVFDKRVAVDQHLQPSQTYGICPHCGDPGTLKIACERCAKPAIVCTGCNEKECGRTCSKNCAYIQERVG
ncbi:hypothetical protein A3F36_01170 [Candidatus Peribacteria bacterium RIFCSPHIGHO2_12_FULL_55_11]|nr:MAG: hypothetical protein A3F36_01170 [Candidatus Peribacteria bacterium RIFCSPHIGHO2_12_FULL_55_11]